MADTENTSTESRGSSGGGNATHTALKAAAAAAATGAAAVAVKKALSSGSNGSGNGNGSGEKSGSQSLVKSVASGSWDAAQDALVPLAADAAAAAGKYLATSGPDVVKDQIVPKFIDAFNEAS